MISFDTETQHRDPKCRVKKGPVNIRDHEVVAIGCGDGENTYVATSLKDPVMEKIRRILADPQIPKVAHNAAFDLGVCEKSGIEVNGVVHCSALLAHTEGFVQNKSSLKWLTKHLLHKEVEEYEKIDDYIYRMGECPEPLLRKYLTQDVVNSYDVFDTLWDMAIERWGRATDVYQTDRALIPVVNRIENKGLRIDQDKLDRLRSEVEKEYSRLNSYFEDQVGVNPRSYQQLQKLIYGPDSKASTDKKALTHIVNEGWEMAPLCEKLLKFRAHHKLLKTYLNPIHRMTIEGFLYTSLNPIGTVTGRFSSRKPNLQNLPRPSNDSVLNRVRGLIIPRPGYVLVSSDYSSIELRVLAHYAMDTAMIQLFKENRDLHDEVQREAFGDLYDSENPEQRTAVKGVNFGVTYSRGETALTEQLKSRQMARRIQGSFFRRFPDTKKFIDECQREAKYGELVDEFGRRYNLSNKGAYVATNRVIQGASATLLKNAMIECDKRVRSIGGSLLLTIHDELLFEIPDEGHQKLQHRIKFLEEGMESQGPLCGMEVPTPVETGWSRDSWTDAGH